MRILALSMVIVVLAACGPSDKQRAQEAFETGDCQSAHVLYDVLAHESPRDHQALVGAGLAQWCLGRYEEADRLLGRALALDREKSEAAVVDGIRAMAGKPGLYGLVFEDQLQLIASAAGWVPRFTLDNPSALLKPLAQAVDAEALLRLLETELRHHQRKAWDYRDPPEEIVAWTAGDDRLPANLRVAYAGELYARARDQAQPLTAEQRLALGVLAMRVFDDMGESEPADFAAFVLATVRDALGEPRIDMPAMTPLMGMLVTELNERQTQRGKRDEYVTWLLAFGRPGLDLSRPNLEELLSRLDGYRQQFPDGRYLDMTEQVAVEQVLQTLSRAIAESDGDAFPAARARAEQLEVPDSELAPLLQKACTDPDMSIHGWSEQWVAERQRCAADYLNKDVTLRDCEECPEMVLIPPGGFIMGSSISDREGPQRLVQVDAFLFGIAPVTVSEFRWFITETGYRTDAEKDVRENLGCFVRVDDRYDWSEGHNWQNPQISQEDDHPVVCISLNDAQEYADWLSQITGETYRIPSEVEWEYAVRSGTDTLFNTGDCITTDQANIMGIPFHDCPGGTRHGGTTAIKSYEPNAFGLYDTHGNVWEWTADCWNSNYSGAPTTSIAWLSGDCERTPVRGGEWGPVDMDARSARRHSVPHSARSFNNGFRIARSVTP